MISKNVTHTVNHPSDIIHPSKVRRKYNSQSATGRSSTSQPRKSGSTFIRPRSKSFLEVVKRKSDVPYRKGFSKERVVINIRGVKYETQLGTLHRFPDSLLGDPKKRSKYYDKGRCEYFFDRDRDCFDAILFFYQSNGMILQRPEGVPISVFIGDVKFFELGVDVFENLKLSESILPGETRPVPKNRFLKHIWLRFEYPDSSKMAKYISHFTFFATAVSVAAMCVETLPSNKYYKHLNMSENRRVEAIMENDFTKIDDPMFIVRTLCNFWFILEYLVRLASCPRKVQFLKNFLNVINILALIPYCITLHLALHELSRVRYIETRIEMLRALRVVTLIRESKYITIFIATCKDSIDGILNLVLLIAITVASYATALYFAEKASPDSEFESVQSGFLFVLETLTTLGAGHKRLRTSLGKLAAAACAVSGIIIFALLISVVASSFILLYSRNLTDVDAIRKAEMDATAATSPPTDSYYIICHQLGPPGISHQRLDP